MPPTWLGQNGSVLQSGRNHGDGSGTCTKSGWYWRQALCLMWKKKSHIVPQCCSRSRSRRKIKPSVSYKESSGSDSDYTPKPKREKPLLNLREPSKEHMATQKSIVKNRKSQGLSSIEDSVLSTNANKDSDELNQNNNTPDIDVGTGSQKENSKLEVKPGVKPEILGVAVMCSIHPKGWPRKAPHSKPTPHSRPKLPSSPTKQDTTNPKKSPGNLDTKEFGLKKWKRVQKFRCKMCGFTTTSQLEANKHYKATHPKLQCPQCPMTFNNPSWRQRHMYSHRELKYPCTRCGKHFPFESALANHRIVHQRHTTQKCNAEGGSCDKWFYTIGDLNKHLKTHQNKVHQCFECSYTTYDPHYLKVHQYTHSNEEKYVCKKCGKLFQTSYANATASGYPGLCVK